RSVAPVCTALAMRHQGARVTAQSEREAAPADHRHSPLVGSASFKRVYAMTNVGKPACHRLKSQSVLCSPAPSRPPGAKTPGKVTNHGITISAVKRYPLAIARRARERRMANWLNSRTAVIKSFMKTALP